MKLSVYSHQKKKKAFDEMRQIYISENKGT